MVLLLQANENVANTANAHNLVTIRIKPDENGRFGFNVKVNSLSLCISSIAHCTLISLTKAVQQLLSDNVPLFPGRITARLQLCGL